MNFPHAEYQPFLHVLDHMTVYTTIMCKKNKAITRSNLHMTVKQSLQLKVTKDLVTHCQSVHVAQIYVVANFCHLLEIIRLCPILHCPVAEKCPNSGRERGKHMYTY